MGAWAHKLGSRSRYGATRLWYADCFAGPWRSANEELRDTSVHIGLEALRMAASTWREKGHKVELAAIFVEKNAKAFSTLETYLAERRGDVELREKCGVQLAADLAIPHPTRERTWFRLALGGHHPAIVELFRQVERKVCGAEAGEVRTEAKRRGDAQLDLGLAAITADQSYERLHLDGLNSAPQDLLAKLRKRSPRRYDDLWPAILANRHILRSDLNRIVWSMHQREQVVIRGVAGRQRTPKDDNLVALGPGAPPATGVDE